MNVLGKKPANRLSKPPGAVPVDDPDDVHLPELGPLFEHHHAFPQRTNTEFVKAIDQGRVKMRVWERGAGETLASGTGACAVAVAGVLTGRSVRRVTVELRGGDLEIEQHLAHEFEFGAQQRHFRFESDTRRLLYGQ